MTLPLADRRNLNHRSPARPDRRESLHRIDPPQIPLGHVETRGWCAIVYCCEREDGEVDGWPAGKYIVRDPAWHPIEPFPMEGFRGYRWAPDELTLWGLSGGPP